MSGSRATGARERGAAGDGRSGETEPGGAGFDEVELERAEREDVELDAVATRDPGLDPRIPALIRRPELFAWLLAITGAIGFAASFGLTLEYLHKLQSPNDGLVCDLSIFVTCGPAMLSNAAHIFGFPNVIIGLASFAVVITTAFATWAGARLRGWYWMGLQLGVLGAAALITYLQWYSVFELQRLCLWCMIIWSTTIPLVVAVTTFNAVRGRFGEGARRLATKTSDLWWVAAIVWALIVVGVILIGMRSLIFGS